MFYVWAVSEMRQFLYTSDNENLCVNIDVILVAFLPLLYYTTFCKLKVKYTVFFTYLLLLSRRRKGEVLYFPACREV